MDKPSFVQVIRSRAISELIKARFPFATKVQLGSFNRGEFKPLDAPSDNGAIQVTWPADSPEDVTKKDLDLIVMEKKLAVEKAFAANKLAEVKENLELHRKWVRDAESRASNYYEETNKACASLRCYKRLALLLGTSTITSVGFIMKMVYGG